MALSVSNDFCSLVMPRRDRYNTSKVTGIEVKVKAPQNDILPAKMRSRNVVPNCMVIVAHYKRIYNAELNLFH